MTERTRPSWPVFVLAALCAGAIAAAVLLVGPASGSERGAIRTATVAQGVVQSTVSGSGNLQPISQLNLGFKTPGTVMHIYVTQDQHVTAGQLLAELDPQSAEVTLEQARAALQAAEANLAKEQETDGETAAGQSPGDSGSGGGSASASSAGGPSGANGGATTDAYVRYEPTADVASAEPRVRPSPGGPQRTPTRTPTTTPTRTPTTTSTCPASTAPIGTGPSSATPATPTRTSPSVSKPVAHEPGSDEVGGSSSSSSGASVSSATREANLASAKAAVRSDKLTAQSAEQAVQDTRLYAPQTGTIVSLSGQVGEVVSASGTTRSSSASNSSSATGSSGAAGTASSSARSGAGAQSSSSGGSNGSSASSSAFAVLSDLSSMQLVVPLSESEIGDVKAGQIATVTVEALEGRKLAAHVSSVAILSTSNSGVVSYDVTFQLDQMDAGLKPGISASAEVVVKQAEGVNVPTSAISADAVTVVRNGRQVRHRVLTGLAGNSSTIVLSGLRAGETVLLRSAAPAASGSSGIGRGGGRFGGGLPGSGGLAGGGALFFRGGGG